MSERCSNCFYHDKLDNEAYDEFVFCFYCGEEVEENDHCEHYEPEDEE